MSNIVGNLINSISYLIHKRSYWFTCRRHGKFIKPFYPCLPTGLPVTNNIGPLKAVTVRFEKDV